jgi:hypothetical protein
MCSNFKLAPLFLRFFVQKSGMLLKWDFWHPFWCNQIQKYYQVVFLCSELHRDFLFTQPKRFWQAVVMLYEA